jgi:uncharacterized membrane protein YphA (DoxX/SURF4 family)
MFPNGLPGGGLLLLRVVCSFFVVIGAQSTFGEKGQMLQFILQAIACIGALLILVGLWTPIAAILVSLLELWGAASGTKGVENAILLATLAAALGVLGPGSHSVDARVFGRKRIQIRDS